jgi:hypothetical protein
MFPKGKLKADGEVQARSASEISQDETVRERRQLSTLMHGNSGWGIPMYNVQSIAAFSLAWRRSPLSHCHSHHHIDQL